MKPFLILLDIIFITLYIVVLYVLYSLGRVPRDISVLDLVLLGLAAARLSDIINTDEIMQWLREPFVRLEETQVAGQEVMTRVGRGRGFRRVIGDLLACPWCTGVWAAAGLTYLFFIWPSIIWLLILVLAVAEISSFIQTLTTIMVRVGKYLKALGTEEEEV